MTRKRIADEPNPGKIHHYKQKHSRQDLQASTQHLRSRSFTLQSSPLGIVL
ncbi:hypothetical protein [Gloeocapsopsis dulcis]|uniref:hypothetical protein n=1 Tax=Gloeocapsopsis dulcis TaxID=2859516 RepID=UPI0012DAA483|nr:hypothetical protein [Gloeocapsopsis dulcis]WNN90278.1 hypothetical protein P0S91_04050 [Gloeocapsopsis dulcis]